MKNDNANGELSVEILKHRMDRILSSKNQTIDELNINISKVENDLNILNLMIKWFESYLKQLKLKRELAEIECFKELIEIHKKIQRIQNDH